MTRQEFINKMVPLAREDMKKTGVLASLTIAQSILESNNGNSELTKQANNLFGIKGEYKGKSIYMRTREQKKTGETYYVQAQFRKYDSWLESITDHSSLFVRLQRYKNVLFAKDYKTACIEVQKAGYATDLEYSNLLISLIEQYKLYEYDNIEPYIDLSKEVSNIIKHGVSLYFNSWKNTKVIKLENVNALLSRLGGISYLTKIKVINEPDKWYKGKYTKSDVASLIQKYNSYINVPRETK